MNADSLHPQMAAILADNRRKQLSAILTATAVAGIIVCAFAYAGAFDPRRYADALPTILKLAADAMPPDFSRWREWGRPLLETLSMSIAGTALGAGAALPLGALAARNIVGPNWIGGPVRAVPERPAFHPRPDLGRDLCRGGGVRSAPRHPGAGHALDGHVGQVLRRDDGACRFRPRKRFAQPRCFAARDLTFLSPSASATEAGRRGHYRWEHNLRAATPWARGRRRPRPRDHDGLSPIRVSRSLSARILVLLGLVTAITMIGAQLSACPRPG